MSNLRTVLAGLYWNVEEARRIVLEVGMNPAFVSFGNRSVNTWTSILEEAQHHGKLQNIIEQAREEYPRIQALALAERDSLLSVEAPEMQDGAWHGPRGTAEIEKITGAVSTLRPISFLQRGLEISGAVARIRLVDGSMGSGFLVRENLLVTNHHVIPSKAAARGARVEFNCQKTAQGLDAEVSMYDFAADNGFATSPEEERDGDDWTAICVAGDPGKKWGTVNLTRANPKVQDEVIIIQHPGGGPKQIALSHNVVAFVSDRRIQYLTDTLEGSSGSPVFGTDWQVVALHHKGGWLREPGSKRAVFRNQGVHINVVIDGLSRGGLI